MSIINKVAKLVKDLFVEPRIQTTKEIHDRIVSGDLTVDYGLFFVGYDNPESYFLEELTNRILPYTKFIIPCFILADVGLFIDEKSKILKFHKHDWCDYSPIYNHVEIDQDIADITTGTLPIPSGILYLANNFSEKVNPEPVHGMFNINYYQDRKRIGKWYLDNNQIAYGQMGNMSLDVYYNASENHIILGSSLDWLEDKSMEAKQYRKLLKSYINMGTISLSMWRWEAADSETVLSRSELINEKEIIELPINGNNVRFEHYYGTLNESPLTKYCYSQFWIE